MKALEVIHVRKFGACVAAAQLWRLYGVRTEGAEVGGELFVC